MYVRMGRLFFTSFLLLCNYYYYIFTFFFFQSISSQNERDMNESVTLALNLLPIQEKITIAEVRTSPSYKIQPNICSVW